MVAESTTPGTPNTSSVSNEETDCLFGIKAKQNTNKNVHRLVTGVDPVEVCTPAHSQLGTWEWNKSEDDRTPGNNPDGSYAPRQKDRKLVMESC